MPAQVSCRHRLHGVLSHECFRPNDIDCAAPPDAFQASCLHFSCKERSHSSLGLHTLSSTHNKYSSLCATPRDILLSCDAVPSLCFDAMLRLLRRQYCATKMSHCSVRPVGNKWYASPFSISTCTLGGASLHLTMNFRARIYTQDQPLILTPQRCCVCGDFSGKLAGSIVNGQTWSRVGVMV